MSVIRNTILTEVDGKQYEVNTDTGEATEMITMIVPLGTRWQTPDEQEKARKRRELLKQREENEQVRKKWTIEKNSLLW